LSAQNVASHSNSQLPLQYRLAATWRSHESSLLLWTLMLGGVGPVLLFVAALNAARALR
jgi:cytochrome c biogenesis factor